MNGLQSTRRAIKVYNVETKMPENLLVNKELVYQNKGTVLSNSSDSDALWRLKFQA